jgi:Flp pilus assembly protein TadG
MKRLFINNKIKNLFKKTNGVTTIEFAIIFPLIFLICFMSILFIFRIGDSMLINYEASRISRLQSVDVTIDTNDSYYNNLVKIPTLNGFQNKNITSTVYSEGTNFNIISTNITADQAAVPNLLMALSILNAGEINRAEYNNVKSKSLRIKEPYIPGL